MYLICFIKYDFHKLSWMNEVFNVIQGQINGADTSVIFGETKQLHSNKEQIKINPSDFDKYLKKITKVLCTFSLY